MGEYMGGSPARRNKATGTFGSGRALMIRIDED
jgi:hypothetical protein